MSGRRCECELRDRQWNGYGRCLHCGAQYVDERTRPPPYCKEPQACIEYEGCRCKSTGAAPECAGVFTEDEYKANAGSVAAHAVETGRATVVRADGSPRVVISVPPAEAGYSWGAGAGGVFVSVKLPDAVEHCLPVHKGSVVTKEFTDRIKRIVDRLNAYHGSGCGHVEPVHRIEHWKIKDCLDLIRDLEAHLVVADAERAALREVLANTRSYMRKSGVIEDVSTRLVEQWDVALGAYRD